MKSFTESALISAGLKTKQKLSSLEQFRIGVFYLDAVESAMLPTYVAYGLSVLRPLNQKFGNAEHGSTVRIDVDSAIEKPALEAAASITDISAIAAQASSAKIVALLTGQLATGVQGYIIGVMPHKNLHVLEEAIGKKLDTTQLGILVLATGNGLPNDTVLATLWKNYRYSQQRITLVAGELS